MKTQNGLEAKVKEVLVYYDIENVVTTEKKQKMALLKILSPNKVDDEMRKQITDFLCKRNDLYGSVVEVVNINRIFEVSSKVVEPVIFEDEYDEV